MAIYPQDAISNAIIAILDGGEAEYSFDGEKIISWVSDTVDEPTQSEIDAKVKEIGDILKNM